LELGRRVAEEIEFAPMAQRDAFFGAEAYRADMERRRDRRGHRVVRVMTLFDAYVAEAGCKPATVKAWRQCLHNLVAYLKHDDASKVTPHDLVAWKEHLAAPKADGVKRSARTIRDKYLAAAKTLFKWAADNHKLENNPAANINMRVRKKPRLREAGLTDDEASLILSASLTHQNEAAHSLQAFARRWIPWLCAYTGARVGEISQLRSEDIRKEQGLTCIRVTPEAGTQKGDKARVVPLHPHLLEQGFMDAVKGRTGPLFYDPANYRGGSDGNPQSKKVAERLAKWVRSIGVTDTEVQPNHGWRHRFKTQARLVGMDPETRDAIQGHSHRTEGESYGDHPPLALMRAIRMIPAYLVMPDGNVKAPTAMQQAVGS
jgi:integrase